MLKLGIVVATAYERNQPPSGGCVLKLNFLFFLAVLWLPAAFRRLCVETGDLAAAAAYCRSSRLQAAVC